MQNGTYGPLVPVKIMLNYFSKGAGKDNHGAVAYGID